MAVQVIKHDSGSDLAGMSESGLRLVSAYALYRYIEAPDYAIGFAAGVESVIPDAVLPVVTFVSPTPGVAPGQPGGFPADPFQAKSTPIVLQISDVDPGVSYVNLVVRYTDEDGTSVEETVYRRSNFRGRFVKRSKAEMVGGALQLTIYRDGGWMELVTGTSKQFGFYVDAVDGAGNVSVEV